MITLMTPLFRHISKLYSLKFIVLLFVVTHFMSFNLQPINIVQATEYTVSATSTQTTEVATEAVTEQATTEQKKKPSKKKKTIEVTISAAGDCTLGVDSRYNNSFNNYYSKNGASYFFKNVKSIFSKDDITIVNFEGTLTNSTARANKTYTFKGPATYTSILKKGSVEVVNLANNHTFDFGTTGYNDTKAALTKSKIRYCNGSTIAYKTIEGVKIAFLGFNALNGVRQQQVKATIKQAKSKKAKIIIASFHWGIELDYYPNSAQKSLAHCAIDSGASLVLGHHPHILQGIEQYKNRYIVYSLGNFCFGGHTNPKDKDSMIYQQTFYVKNGKLLKKNDIKVIPCSITSVSSHNNFQPTVLKGTNKKRAIQKINQLSKGMNASFNNSGTANSSNK